MKSLQNNFKRKLAQFNNTGIKLFGGDEAVYKHGIKSFCDVGITLIGAGMLQGGVDNDIQSLQIAGGLAALIGAIDLMPRLISLVLSDGEDEKLTGIFGLAKKGVQKISKGHDYDKQ